MTDHVQPDWAGAPDWANFWAADSDGYAYWYRDEPTYNAKYGGWLRTLGEEPDVSFDLCWPPEGFDNRDIDWASTLRSRP
jgi:hypothetical protein